MNREIKFTKQQLKEIEARVKFKMDDIKSWLKNQIGLKWQQAFQSGDQKYEWYMNALKDIEEVIKKERDMPLPREIMSKDDFYKKREEAVDKFTELFRLHETGQYRHKINSVLRIVEELLKE